MPVDIEQIDAFLAHHGVKGMHWGSRRSPEEASRKLDTKIGKVSARIADHDTAIKNVKSHIKDAEENGTRSELFKKKYGNIPSEGAFQLVHGMSRNEALQKHKESLQDELSEHQDSKDIHQIRLNHLQKKKEKISHSSSDIDGVKFDAFLESDIFSSSL